MATLATQTLSQSGLVPTLTACSGGGDTFPPTNSTFLYVKNGDASPHTITIITTLTVFGQAVSDIAVPIAAGAICLLGPYDPGEVGASGTGLASVTYSAVTSMQIAVIQT